MVYFLFIYLLNGYLGVVFDILQFVSLKGTLFIEYSSTPFKHTMYGFWVTCTMDAQYKILNLKKKKIMFETLKWTDLLAT